VSIFVCDECGCIDNTALTGYWKRKQHDGKARCSECDPGIKKWHGLFDRRPYDPKIDVPINRPLPATPQSEED
jgi:hypothetical protein